ncbi:hypothetical protein [Nocardiopsis potens]|uniref:hypothetical protein n=1 Tax=Nocardiopsis potens TaxID=1246458 RepID=UPI00034D40D8|nr:hypothetical protein [Nocardiopsis potens]
MNRFKKGAASLLVAAAAASGAFLAAAPAGADTVGAYGPPNDTRVEQRNMSPRACEVKANMLNQLPQGWFRKYWCVTSNPPKMNLMSMSR